jgi:hypothetical protein
MCNVGGDSVVFIQKFIYFGPSMLVRVACLKEVVLAFGVSYGILCNIVHWKVDMFDLLSKREYIVIRGVKILQGNKGIKVWMETDGVVEVGGGFKVY